MPPPPAVQPTPQSLRAAALLSLTGAPQLLANICSAVSLPPLLMHSVRASAQPFNILSVLLEVLESIRNPKDFPFTRPQISAFPKPFPCCSSYQVMNHIKVLPLPLPPSFAFPSLVSITLHKPAPATGSELVLGINAQSLSKIYDAKHLWTSSFFFFFFFLSPVQSQEPWVLFSQWEYKGTNLPGQKNLVNTCWAKHV